MRTITEEIKLYTYTELSEKAKLRALNDYIDFQSSTFKLDDMITQEELNELLAPLQLTKEIEVNSINWELSACGYICNGDLSINHDNTELLNNITRKLERLIIERYNEHFDYDTINEFLKDSDYEYTETGRLF